jgi:hypothetical protein
VYLSSKASYYNCPNIRIGHDDLLGDIADTLDDLLLPYTALVHK